MKKLLLSIRVHLIVAAVGLIGFGLLFRMGVQCEWIIRGLLIYAGLDLIWQVVFERPLIKPGPWAKSMHPGLDKE